MADRSISPRFVVAKYVPDIDRMEPKNIGVILWAKGRLCAKFLETQQAAAFVNELPVYDRWVKFWSERIDGDAIVPQRGRPVPVASVDCLDALLTTQKGNYILLDGGELLQSIRKKEIGAATDFLFQELVAFQRQVQASAAEKSRTLAAIEAAKTPAQRLKEKQAACTHEFDKIVNLRRVECTICGLRVTKEFALGYYVGKDAGYDAGRDSVECDF